MFKKCSFVIAVLKVVSSVVELSSFIILKFYNNNVTFRNISNILHKEIFTDHIHCTNCGINITATRVLETIKKEF